MTVDIFGPTVGAGGVTVRPGETRSFTGADTFFRDCSAPELDDGTEIQAAWLNQLLANARTLARGNGVTGTAVSVVAEDNTDDGLLLKAVQHLIQRDQPKYARDIGGSGAIVITLSPTPAEIKEGMTVIVKVATTSNGPTTLNANGLGAVAVKHQDGGDIGPGDLTKDGIFGFTYDGTNWQLVWKYKQPGTKTYLSVPLTYYVNDATGNDSYDGLAAGVGGGHGPFKTLARANEYIRQWILNGVDITVNVADGTYAGVALDEMTGNGGHVKWIGNAAAPGNCIVAGVNKNAFSVGGKLHSLTGFKVTTSGVATVDGLNGISVNSFGRVLLNNMEFGTCGGAQISLSNSIVDLGVGNHKISGGSAGNSSSVGAFIEARQNSYFNGGGAVTTAFTIVGTPAYGAAFVQCDGLSHVQLFNTTFSGSATGKRYSASGNSFINTGGGGVNYFPGNVAGTLASGAEYA
jgi:hypothetical protein